MNNVYSGTVIIEPEIGEIKTLTDKWNTESSVLPFDSSIPIDEIVISVVAGVIYTMKVTKKEPKLETLELTTNLRQTIDNTFNK